MSRLVPPFLCAIGAAAAVTRATAAKSSTHPTAFLSPSPTKRQTNDRYTQQQSYPFSVVSPPDSHSQQHQRLNPTSSTLHQSSRNSPEDLYGAIHRKEYEMKSLNAQHKSLSDPIRIAMSYVQETEPKLGMADMGMRRGSFIVDIKRRSLSRPGEIFARFDDASMVAEAMVGLGADVVFVNVDYHSYGGDISELKSAVRAVKRISDKAAVVMKDIVVDEIQLGLAKDAGVDGIVLIASVLGPALSHFLNLATIIGLETIVEVHTRDEVQYALDSLAQTILVSNYDRVRQEYHPDQAYKLAGMFPGSGGPIITLAGGGIESTEQMKRLLSVGYDGVVVGKAVMGSARAPEFIKAVRDRTLLPAELSQWGLEDVEFDMEGNVMDGPKKGIPDGDDPDAFL